MNGGVGVFNIINFGLNTLCIMGFHYFHKDNEKTLCINPHSLKQT